MIATLATATNENGHKKSIENNYSTMTSLAFTSSPPTGFGSRWFGHQFTAAQAPPAVQVPVGEAEVLVVMVVGGWR